MADYEDLPGAYERALAKQEVTEKGCHEFTGSKDKDGYGRVSITKGGMPTKIKTHVLSWLIKEGREVLPRDTLVRHMCANPACFNPQHLVIGNDKDNRYDTILDGHDPRNNFATIIEDWPERLRALEVLEEHSKNMRGLKALYVTAKEFEVNGKYIKVLSAADRNGSLDVVRENYT